MKIPMKSGFWWKCVASVLLFCWALSELLPIKDQPFNHYLEEHVDAHQEAFNALLARAQACVREGQSPTLFVALKTIAKEERVDLSIYFPELDLADLKNLDQRNEVLLNYLLQDSQGRVKLGLDLRGGLAFTLKLDEAASQSSDNYLNTQRLEKAVEIMHNRINGLGVAEPLIRINGTDHIEIQLPGVTTQENPDAIAALQKPAKLTFHKVNRDRVPNAASQPGDLPGYTLMEEENVNPRTGEVELTRLYVKRIPDLMGDSVESAYASMADAGGYQINLNFTPAGTERFKELTAQIAAENQSPKYSRLPENSPGRYGRLAIVLDGKLYSAPRVTEAIPGGHARISGDFTQREAIELANVLNNPLEFALSVDEMYEVGPSLAEDARDASINASILGVALVALFMIAYYRFCGVIAMIAVAMNIMLTLAAMAMLGATLTLPGVAALVLNMGMAVDAHILIFERMREELRQGKSMKAALVAGHHRAFGTILDSNLTTLLVSVILILLGTGPVKGFGVSLSLGILATLFTAMVVSYMFLELFVNKGWLKSMVRFSFFKDSKIAFLKMGRGATILSLCLIIAGAAGIFIRGKSILGVDFTGGEAVTLSFNQKISLSDIQAAAKAEGVEYLAPVYQTLLGDAKEKLRIETQTGQSADVILALKKHFPEAGFVLLGEQHIGASVSESIQWNAIESILVAFLGILLYVAFRFEMGYGVGAALATLLDACMAVSIFVLVGGQFSSSMVAAVLMIIGYSINDKIVVFDRIREELVLNPTLRLAEVINLSINRTLSRTTLTSLTTFLAALALYIFGAGEICHFAFLFMLGIILGTLSSIFIASPIFYWWHKGDRHHVEAREVLPRYDWDASSKAGR